jgi:phosphoadenosine phosphosulfate reductase
VETTLQAASPQEIIAYAVRSFERPVLACSFGGASGMALLDMTMQIDPTVPVYYLDTDLLFPETYALVESVAARYGIEPIAVRTELSLDEQAARYGPELWAREPDRCCALRKVEPQRAFLSAYDAWITGIRRDQSPTRASAEPVAWEERFELMKISPLVEWDERMVWTYIRAHGVPYNALHERSYPSIGCIPCTRAVAHGDDARAGRWAGFSKVECGLHA